MSVAARRFIAWAMVAVGVTIVAVAGPCTLYFGGGALFALLRGEPGAFIIVPALVVGGLPTALGSFLAISGWRRVSR